MKMFNPYDHFRKEYLARCLIDDDLTTRKYLCWLQQFDSSIRCDFANDGLKAIEHLKADKVNVLIAFLST
jgi:hypothetical protein